MFQSQLNNMKKISAIIVCMVSVCYGQAPTEAPVSFAKSAGLYVFPAKKQSAETQSKDETECYKWAVQQSNYDPMNPTKVEVKQVDKSADGSAVVGAAKGAAAGVAIGAIAGDAGKGAAIGAVAGGLAGRRAKKVGDAQEQQQNQQAATQQSAELLNNFKKAFTACLEAKGYTVK
jgi:uncharacterized protein YcfJ